MSSAHLSEQFDCHEPWCVLPRGHELEDAYPAPIDHRPQCAEGTPDGGECGQYDGHDGPHEPNW